MSVLNLLAHVGRLYGTATSRFWVVEARLKGFKIGSRSLFMGRPILSRHPGSSIQIGDGFSCYNSPRANLIACAQPCVVRTLTDGASISIGDDVGMSAVVVVASSRIEIGAQTQIGSGAVIIDNDLHSRCANGSWGPLKPLAGRSVKIGSRVFIGARAFILKGVTIGDDAVIGAGAVVTKDVPAKHLAFGNPATIRPPRLSP